MLEAGHDFDLAVFSISLGSIPFICPELLERSPSWRALVDNVRPA